MPQLRDDSLQTPPATGCVALSGLSVIVPCLDEEDNIERTIREVARTARRIANRYEIIVVDDGSRDATPVIAASVPGVRVIRHPSNRGLGAAVRSGLRAATEPYVLLTDADLQLDLRNAEEFARHLQHADLIIGRRVDAHDRLRRRVARNLWNLFARRLLGLPVHDPDCSLRLMRREPIADLALQSDGPAIHAELIARALRRGARVREVVVCERVRRAGGRRGGHLPRMIEALRELAELRAALAPLPERP